MAAVQRLPSGPLAFDLFGDGFDDVVAALFSGDGEAPAWLDAPLPEVAPPPAKAAQAVLPLGGPRAAARAAPPPDAKQAVTPLHRCVNPTHTAPCAWCTPAPSAEDELEYELVGDPGKKNGEKKLRSQLTHTPEWNNVEERYRLASICEAMGMDALAFVLRNKGCSSLRKTHLMFLARTWGYQSELWCRRDERRQHVAKMDRARAAQAAAAAAAGHGGAAVLKAAPAPRPLPAKRPAPGGHAGGVAPPRTLQKLSHVEGAGFRGGAAAGGAAALAAARAPPPVPSMMLPRAGAARSTAGGISAWAVDVRHGAPAPGGLARPAGDDEGAPLAAIAAHVTVTLRPLAAESVRLFGGAAAPGADTADHAEVLAAAEWLREIAADTAAALSRLRARAAALPRDTARTVAWLHLLNQPCALEDCMMRLQQGLHCAALDYTAPAPGAPPGARWPEDMVQGALMGLELVARCQALATQSKFTAYGTYIKVTVQLKALIADFTANVANALVIRSSRLAAAASAAPAPELLHLGLSDILGKELSDGDGVDEGAVASGFVMPPVEPPPELLPLPAPVTLAVAPPPPAAMRAGSQSDSAGSPHAFSTDGSDASALWA